MATTPFIATSVPVAGATPGKVRDTPAGMRRYWLGKPGQMIELPAPKIGREVSHATGESVHTSAGGVTTVFRRADSATSPGVKRRFVLQWDRLAGRDWQIVYAFYRRKIVGPGPWCYLPPEDTNRLDEATSLCQDAGAWGEIGSGTITADTTVTSPLLPSGVIRWSGAAAGDLLLTRPLNTAGTGPDLTAAIPYLPSEPLTLTAWLWVPSGTRQVRLRASGRTTAGAVATETDTLVTLTTTPQLVTLTAAAGALGTSAYVVPTVVAVGTAVDVLVAAPQFEYASAATPFTLGNGVPRVVWTDPPGRELDARLRSATTMTLAE